MAVGGPLLVLLVAVAVAAVAVGPTMAGSSTEGLRPADTVAAPSGRAAIDDIAARMLTVRPSVGATWVVSVDGLSSGRQILLRTLQGVVNRTEARLYLVDGSDQGAQRWLDTFQAEGLVTVAGTTDVAGAVDRFAAEASGYVLADPAVPWTVHVAATIAGAEGALVASPDEVAMLEAEGLTLIEDVRGRWPDAATAYEGIVAERGDDLPHAGVAVLRPDDRGLDFAVQQGMLVLFSRPSAPDWARVSALIADRPAGTPVFGYLSDTGDEEAVAVGTLATSGLVLVPSDTVRNLSFQVAVGADRPREVIEPVEVEGVEPCSSDTLNVVVGLTDGDNVNVPLNRFSGPANWGAPQRGDLPLGWSLTPSLAVLAPAAWDAYVREATASDELVGMIGWGYGAPSLMVNARAFYEESYALMDQLGMRTFWSLGGGLETAGTSGWTLLDEAAATTATGTPDGVLVGYGGGSGVGRAFHSPEGRPAFTSGSAYLDTPAMLTAQVEALLALPSSARPLVSFLSATNWSNPAGALIDALAPFEARGVRFLTPAEATACMPEASVEPPPEAGPGECLPSDVPTQHGLALISDAAAVDMVRTPSPSPVAVSAAAPSSVEAGSEVAYSGVVAVDLPGLAAEVLEARVRPIVEAGYGGELAASAWVEMGLSDVVVRVEVPPGTSPVGSPEVVTGGGAVGGASASWSPGALEVMLPGPVAVDSRTPGAPVEVEMAWSVATSADAASFEAVLAAAEVSFDLQLTIGVMLGAIPLTGGAGAPWACTPEDEPLARTSVLGSTTTTSSTTSSTTSTSAPSSTSTSSPSTTSEPAGSTTGSDPGGVAGVGGTGVGSSGTSAPAVPIRAPAQFTG